MGKFFAGIVRFQIPQTNRFLLQHYEIELDYTGNYVYNIPLR